MNQGITRKGILAAVAAYTGITPDFANDYDGQLVIYTGLVENKVTYTLHVHVGPDDTEWHCKNCGNTEDLPTSGEVLLRSDGEYVCPDCGSTEIYTVEK